ncbi:hypothetical protein BRARA_C00387 [Brassica rapa]|uniref:Uncharacterized protein n=1 Tax=Brassica campestris TaxID=3711 RepID=A0A397ZUV2_BRACM|nr:hypothetical protein BRARA_C00387 [Brassica rapa]
MVFSTNRKFFFTSFLFLIILTKASTFGISSPKQVVMINKLGVRQTIDVHCRSGNKDLGPVSLRPGAIMTTKYTCSFRWPDAGKELWYDIFTSSRDANVCNLCLWYIFDSIICRMRLDREEPTICDIWNPLH